MSGIQRETIFFKILSYLSYIPDDETKPEGSEGHTNGHPHDGVGDGIDGKWPPKDETDYPYGDWT